MEETGKEKRMWVSWKALYWEALKGLKINKPDAEIKKVVTCKIRRGKNVVEELKWLRKKVFKWTHPSPKSKYGFFAQCTQGSLRKIQMMIIGDCRNSNLTCMSEIWSCRKQRGLWEWKPSWMSRIEDLVFLLGEGLIIEHRSSGFES